ncbi:hypothetical protein N7510_009273 [Penicillium lagena]|uniref:uncharacterized protein n=1 Tax=Penicillium lagena TaxID=94218 RepID=UPI002541512E|nr:uncharacterized protein N7510_009273 [Penicillium lagena]KAJ5606492.1 hypothetical protein N7510_009273 [Penicillium lagena]
MTRSTLLCLSMNWLRTTTRQSIMSSPASCSPFTKAVVSSMRKLYPESLADKSFDNTGLLLEAPFDPSRRQRNSVLLTIDLTTAVADEAIRRRDSAVVAYHPIIFRGLKAITLENTQQQSLLRLAQYGISVYSPHTAVDTVPGGMADWLCDIVTGSFSTTKPPPTHSQVEAGLFYAEPVYPEPRRAARTGSTEKSVPHKRTTIHPSPPPIPEGFESAGAGRLITFESPQPLPSLIENISTGTGYPAGITIALPQSIKSTRDATIRTVGVCPGSGSGVLLGGGSELPDLLVTGEMSHHEALAVTERGSVVIALSHSNSERGYLGTVMQQKLADDLKRQWKEDRETALRSVAESAKQGGAAPASGAESVYQDEMVEVAVSEADRDPYGVMVSRIAPSV